jgi:hypothetical protein
MSPRSEPRRASQRAWRHVVPTVGLVGAVTGGLLLTGAEPASADLLAARRFPQAVLAAEAHEPGEEPRDDGDGPLDRLPGTLRDLLGVLAVEFAEDPAPVPELLEQHVQVGRDPREAPQMLSRSLRAKLARFREGTLGTGRAAASTVLDDGERHPDRPEDQLSVTALVVDTSSEPDLLTAPLETIEGAAAGGSRSLADATGAPVVADVGEAAAEGLDELTADCAAAPVTGPLLRAVARAVDAGTPAARTETCGTTPDDTGSDVEAASSTGRPEPR